MDLDLWDCFGRKKTLSYNRINTVLSVAFEYIIANCVVMKIYRKNSKNWDILNYYRDCPTNVIVGFYSAILRSEDADRITNRVDTDQTAP